MLLMCRAFIFPDDKFCQILGVVCEIPRYYYSQIPYIPWPVGVVVLTDNTAKYKKFIVTCNTRTHYIRPLILIIIIKVSLQPLYFMAL